MPAGWNTLPFGIPLDVGRLDAAAAPGAAQDAQTTKAGGSAPGHGTTRQVLARERYLAVG
jgi:hypothetical protein